MKNKAFSIVISIMIFSGFLASAAAFAGADEIKKRMKGRLPIILSLKKQGIIGENNKGFLEFVGTQKGQPQLIEAENSDRRKVYQAISQKQGATAEAVGQRRAIQIAANANPGDWLQDANGKWYKK